MIELYGLCADLVVNMNYCCVGCANPQRVRSVMRLISKRQNVHWFFNWMHMRFLFYKVICAALKP